MKPRHLISPLVPAAWLVAALAVCGAAAAEPDVRNSLSVAEKRLMGSQTFVQTFPDHRWQTQGASAFDAGRFDEARHHFERAAHLGDKLSQAMLAEMHWTGRGGEVNRPAGYAWMDLAAERGYQHLLAFRERYWEQLDETERQRAIAIGDDLYRSYGDEVAKPRMEAALRRTRTSATGSRVGADVVTRVYEGDGMSSTDDLQRGLRPGIDVTGVHNLRFRDPERYWSMIDRAYASPQPAPRVVVREIQRSVPLRRQSSD